MGSSSYLDAKHSKQRLNDPDTGSFYSQKRGFTIDHSNRSSSNPHLLQKLNRDESQFSGMAGQESSLRLEDEAMKNQSEIVQLDQHY